MEAVSELVLAPFREIVKKSNTARENAKSNEQMQKAASALAKDGEKALKTLEPLCQKNVEEFGIIFVNAVKENEEIAQHCEQLDTLLWDLDDDLQEDDFDDAVFVHLKEASRNATNKIKSIIVRMRLQAPVPNSVVSPPPSPHPSQAPYPSSPPPTSAPYPIQEETLLDAIDRLTVDSDDLENEASPPSRAPPPPPMFNPWDTHRAPSVDETILQTSVPIRRVPVPAPHTILSASPKSMDTEERFRRGTVPGHYSDRDSGSSNSQGMRLSTSHSENNVYSPLRTPISPQRWNQQGSFPEESSRASNRDGHGPLTPGEPGLEHNRQISVDSRVSGSEYIGDGSRSPAFRVRTNSIESMVDPSLRHVRVIDQPPQVTAPPVTPLKPSMYVDSDPIPVERENVPVRPVVHVPPKNCVIAQGSSFHLLKGFCPGAKQVLNGNLGVKKTRRPVGLTSSTVVAKCESCSFELNFEHIEDDVNRLDKGNLMKSGIEHRLRFLQKSHVATTRSDDMLFACLFCVESGRTLDSSDATVFFNREALFSHIARHPRPLPDVAGIVVVDQVEVPPELRNDFDIHITRPPVSHPALESASDVAYLPTAVATAHVRRLLGIRLLPDLTPPLELVKGAKLTGVTWPSKYNGEWCMAWHDGAYASIPFENIKLDPPSSDAIKIGATSLVRAKARWKHSVRDKDKGISWLKFDKNEIITNISWAYPEHWCWSGTNARGKWGIFPQAFVDSNTVQEFSLSGFERANDLNNEKNRSTSILNRFASRRNQGPPSIAGSTSSSETAATRSGFTSAYLNTRRNSRTSTLDF